MADIFNGEAPASTNLNDSANYSLAVRFHSTVDGTISAIKWRFPDTLPTSTVTCGLYRVSDTTLLGSGSFSSPTAGQYNSAAIGPVSITASTVYSAQIWTSDRYVATTNYTWPHTNGALVAEATNGYLQVLPGALAFATTASGNSANFFVDVTFTAAGGTTYTLSISGTCTPTGTATKRTNRTLTGSSTPIGAVAKLTARLVAGSSTAAGAIAKTTQRLLGGTSTPTSTLTRVTQKLTAGTTTPTGTTTKLTSRALAGISTPTGAIRKLLSRLLGGAATPAGSMAAEVVEVSDVTVDAPRVGVDLTTPRATVDLTVRRVQR